MQLVELCWFVPLLLFVVVGLEVPSADNLILETVVLNSWRLSNFVDTFG